ncbi:methylaspartate mutase subunit E [Polyangium sp. 15x6]|uniref:methylaspartate mutase subunit E n=1 Tax=Polyangium sp. 15x6 TaxID=3042687 RepID=UPI00249C8A9B|nr:methylaspartate mutase subunit E [Polyangium sp. 15x6]MDI3289010.1 methylaspartate mutase subunit E [Polyangium sp. 15x6]
MKLELEDLLTLRGELFRNAPIPAFPLEETLAALAARTCPSVTEVLGSGGGALKIQPRCGVGGQAEMEELLRFLKIHGEPDILTLTIDAYTRLNLYEKAATTTELNGYPLIHHGAARAATLEAAVGVPLQVRHGSPDGRLLAEVAYRAGLTSFEGGGISYNLPYSKAVPLRRSLRAWQYVDRLTGLASEVQTIDRETFGPLTAVLTPPSISIAISILEMALAVEQGVRAVTIGYPEAGCFYQDMAALTAIPRLCAEHLRRLGLPDVEIFTSFHQWMGVFPKDMTAALALIASGVVSAAAGKATKLINKTHLEAHGVPTKEANAFCIRLCKSLASTSVAEQAGEASSERVAEERSFITREVDEILAAVYDLGTDDLVESVASAFERGLLDIPFSPSRSARGDVLPARGPDRSIRYLDPGRLPFSAETLAHNRRRLGARKADDHQRIIKDINLLAGSRLPGLTSRGTT